METSNIIIDTGGNIIDNPKLQAEFMQDVCDIGGNIVATTYTKLLDQMSIPAKNTLKLEEDEISFDNVTYDLYATSGDAGGQLTFTFNH